MIAEALGGGNSKSVKDKEALNKDRYLLKRRYDPKSSVQLP